MIYQIKLLKQLSTLTMIVFFVSSTTVFPQNYPKKIRGYKVYQTDISVKTRREKTSKKNSPEAIINIGEPELSDISLTGITLEFPAEIEGVTQDGKIDFIMFEDFKVNGLNVEIEEYKESFKLKNDETLVLPKPVRMFIPVGQTLRGAFKELKDSKKEWNVTGKLFVFGKFKKLGFNFKRVIPVNINLKIENPVKKKLAQDDKTKK